MKRKIKLLLAALIMAGMVFLFGQQKGQQPEIIDGEVLFSMEDVNTLFPGTENLVRIQDNLYLVKTAQNERLGFIAYGPPEDAEITGYLGKVPFLIGMDVDYRIKGVHMLPSRETPGYAARVSGRLKNAWTGLGPEEGYRQQVDAVTGATATSLALIDGVRQTLGEISAQPYHDYAAGRVFGRQLAKQVLTLLFLAAAVAYFFLPVSSLRARFLVNIFSVIIPGFLMASLLSLALLGSWAGGFFSWNAHWLLLIICLAAFGIPLFTGRNFYCHNFCPFGSAQYLMGKTRKGKWHIGKKTNLLLQGIRVMLIVAATAVVISGAGINLSFFEPFEAFRWNYASWFTRILALVFLMLSIVIQKPWCRVCPTGGIIEGIRNFSKRFL